MKLIPRRKKTPTTFERAAGFLKLGAKGLAAQRVARRGLKGYRFTKRTVQLAGLGALGMFLSKKLRGGGDVPSTTSYTPPPAPAATSAYDKAEAGETPTDDSLEVEGPNESTPPPPKKTKSGK